MIEEAIERGDQGFRGGWIELGKMALLIDYVPGRSTQPMLLAMGYHHIGKINRGGDSYTLYHTDPNADPTDFWVSNNYDADHANILQRAITEQIVGLRNGWIDTNAAEQATGVRKSTLVKLLDRMGFVRIGRTNRRVHGVRIQKTLYHTDPNADPTDFWASNGYV